MKLTLVFLYASLSFAFVKSSNILAIFPAPIKSGHILGVNLAKGLLKRGHHVTLLSSFEGEIMENYTHVQLKSLLEYKERLWKEKIITPNMNKLMMMWGMLHFFTNINNLLWEETEIRKIIDEKPKYDVVILHNFLNEAVMGLAHHLEVPLILFNPTGSTSIANKYVANPNMVYANTMISVSDHSFLGRLTAVSTNIFVELFCQFFIFPPQQATLKKYLPDCPPLDKLRENVSLVLANSHYSIEPSRPYVPNMVQIGGYHVQDTKALPREMQDYLDEAKDGAILFSMGSNVEIAAITEEKREAIFRVFGEMAPMKVIFKSEITLENVPKNVMVLKWVPQADILAHPNIKVFISHGGLGGNTEAVYHGVPILGIPFFGDQNMNLDEAEAAGYAITLQYDALEEESFRRKLKEIIEDPRYKTNAKKRSALIKEQPVKPMDNAAFWIEHIIKYGGGSHLRNAGMDLAWYELYMVDIYLFYTLFMCLSLVINYYALKFSARMLKKIFQSKKIKTS